MTMPDDMDELLRRAMKTLDDQVPPGYFEGLPNRTLARLEDSSMQPTPGTSSELDSGSTGVPPVEVGADKERDEDSGLHDIRNLASSARMRLSSRRISTHPPVDDDILASSSAGWKAVALPEPAKMISLPEIAELPTKAEIKAKEKADRASRKSGEIAASTSAPAMPAIASIEPPLHLEEPAVASAVVTPMIGSRITGANKAKTATPKQGGSKAAVFGVVGIGLAAAAGVAIYVTTMKSNSSDETASAPAASERTDRSVAVAAPTPAPAPPTVQAIAIDEPAKIEPVDESKQEPAAGAVASDLPKAPSKGKRDAKVDKKPAKTIIEVAPPPDTSTKKPPPPVVTKAGSGKEGDPDFDALLKEAGVSKDKVVKPKLDKTSLTGGDFKSGMNAVRGRAQACFNGTQGTANVKLTIAPSGQVSKAAVSGVFAGTPVAACVEAAVKGATFPAWDGGPQSFGYSYLLSE